MESVWDYILANKLGTATIFFSLSFTCLGLPSQAWTIWKTRIVDGVSPLMFLLLANQSLFWVAYGVQKKDWLVVVANIPVVVFALIIVIEWWVFRQPSFQRGGAIAHLDH